MIPSSIPGRSCSLLKTYDSIHSLELWVNIRQMVLFSFRIANGLEKNSRNSNSKATWDYIQTQVPKSLYTWLNVWCNKVNAIKERQMGFFSLVKASSQGEKKTLNLNQLYYAYKRPYVTSCLEQMACVNLHTHTHTHTYIYIYILTYSLNCLHLGYDNHNAGHCNL